MYTLNIKIDCLLSDRKVTTGQPGRLLRKLGGGGGGAGGGYLSYPSASALRSEFHTFDQREREWDNCGY